MNNIKVLVTGGAGFIGKNLSNFLLEKNFDVLVVDDLSLGNLVGLNKNIHFQKLNILNKKRLETQFQKFKPDYVFHLAALNTWSLNADKDLLNVNIAGTLNVLECVIHNSIKKFIYSSSAAVYGEAKKHPISENDELRPLNLYGVSKVASEVLIKSILGESLTPYSILRFSNVYGPGQRFDNEGGVISIFCNNIINRRKIYVHGDGKQTRDFIYVDNVVDALFKSMLYKGTFIANVSINQETSINNLISLIEFITGQNINIGYKPDSIIEIKRSVLNNTKIKKLLNWRTSIDLKKGVTYTCQVIGN